MANQATDRRLIGSKAVQNIIAKRKIFRVTDDKQLFKFEIQGDGFTLAVTTKDGTAVLDFQGNPLMKTIYNTRVNSHVAMLNERNREILKGAVAAEQDGDMETAHAAFNDYLNKIQVSFSVILNPGQKNKVFSNGDLVKGRVELITTENGQLLTLENNSVTLVPIQEANATAAFTLDDLMGITATPAAETVFTPLEGATTTTA